ncbi:MAG: hypothetical protein K6B65_05885 [Bacilli bacterium]|nr:hypothetical protein [Bacilli bacterium]
MADRKILKGKCKKHGRKFVFQLDKIESEYKVTNMIVASDEEYEVIQSEVKQPKFVTSGLLPDKVDGKRVLGGYDYPERECPFRKQDRPYNIHCTYCKQLELDYVSKAKARSPFGKYKGLSNIPGADKDEYGNPSGADYDLAQDGAFAGYRIVVLNRTGAYRHADYSICYGALAKKGFEVREVKTSDSLDKLKEAFEGIDIDKTQLWVISGNPKNMLLNNQVDRFIKKYYQDGHGLYLLGDDEPDFAEANHFLNILFPGSYMHDEYQGRKILGISNRPNDPGIVKGHDISTGIINFYEGSTVCNIVTSRGLKPLVYASNHKVLACYYDEQGKRLIADGGFTRLYLKWQTAGTERYVLNTAAYLTNVERFGY